MYVCTYVDSVYVVYVVCMCMCMCAYICMDVCMFVCVHVNMRMYVENENVYMNVCMCF